MSVCVSVAFRGPKYTEKRKKANQNLYLITKYSICQQEILSSTFSFYFLHPIILILFLYIPLHIENIVLSENMSH